MGPVLLFGCGIGSEIQQADLEAPQANVAGGWFCYGGKAILNLVQNGREVTGKVTLLESVHSLAVRGQVTGRVVRGTVVPTDTNSPLDWAFIVSADGVTAQWIVDLALGNLSKGAYYRIALGPSSAGWAHAGDPSVAGGIIGYFPVRADGLAVLSPGTADVTRPLLVNLHYFFDQQGTIVPHRSFVALDAPRFAQYVATPLSTQFISRDLDVETLRKARSHSPLYRKHAGTVEGKPCWWVLAPWWDGGSHDLFPNHIMAELYYQDPDGGGLPADYAWEVAKRGVGGVWEPSYAYLLGTQKLVGVSATVEHGMPTGVQVQDVPEPPLSAFLAGKEQTVYLGRWRNRILLLAKTATLPKTLQQSKNSELADLMAKVEQLALDLNHESELNRDQAQKKVEKGAVSAQEIRESKREIGQIQIQLQDPDLAPALRGSLQGRLGQLQGSVAAAEQHEKASEAEVDLLREMATVYKERIEILKPMIVAIKEEVANRAK